MVKGGLEADGVRHRGAAGVLQQRPRNRDPDHVENPPRRQGHLRSVFTRCRCHQGRSTARCRAQGRPPAAMRQRTCCMTGHRSRSTVIPCPGKQQRSSHDCPRTGSQLAHGLRRGPSAAPRIHHRRASAAGIPRQPQRPRGAAPPLAPQPSPPPHRPDPPGAAEAPPPCAANLGPRRAARATFTKDNAPQVAGTDEVDTQPTLGFQRVIQRAIMHVQSTGNGKKEVTGANVLVAIFGEKDSHAVYYRHQQGVTRLDVVNFIAHGIKKGEPPEPVKSDSPAEGEENVAVERNNEKASPLEQFTQNLNQAAKEGRIDPLIGRHYEVERTIQIRCRRRKNNPLLVGEAGVGKTAIAEGLAWRITQNDVPEILAEAVVYSLDMGALLAGTKYRGDFEQKLKGVLKSLKDKPNATLFIDEIHTLIGAGAASGGTLDASTLLKPALSNGQLKCIGATTFTEYRGIFEKDAALSRRFQKVDVVEPSVAETIDILKG